MEIWILFGVLSIVASYDVNNLGIKIPTKRNNTSAICERSGTYCADDCETLMVCTDYSPTPLRTVKCASPNPFCVGNTCRPTLVPSCPNAPQFICTSDGIFPEAGNCRRSRVCHNGESSVYECAAGFIFNINTLSCVEGGFECPAGFTYNANTLSCQPGSGPCGNIDCDSATLANPYVVHASNASFYALCLNNGNEHIQTFMFKCPYEQDEVFDTRINSCRFSCLNRRSGNHQNPANCNEFFRCVTTTSMATLHRCPTGHVFDGSSCNANPSTCRNPPRTAVA